MLLPTITPHNQEYTVQGVGQYTVQGVGQEEER